VTSAPRLQAPSADGAVLAVPPLEQCGTLLDENQRRFAQNAPIGNRSLTELRRAARAELLREAVAYLHEAGEPIPSVNAGRVLLAGHQPEMFHPGVWLKNFALAGLARQHAAVAVNLIIDSDTMKSASLRLPAPADQESPVPYLHTVLFDRWQGEVPFESCHVQDEALFASFADRAQALLQRWKLHPLLGRFWRLVRQQEKRTSLLGERLTAGRRAVERDWGCHNLEVPLSRLCRTEPFAHFAYHLLAELPRLHAVYNDCVREHRRRHGSRSRNHPVPDLAVDGDWLEVPLWAWRAGQQRRGRLFARLRPTAIELRAGAEPWPALPLDPERAVPALLDLAGRGWALRTRALLTALFARLLLGDLFIHGIGGGKYDELTDAIIRRFFGIEPPHFMVLSGTLHLPLPLFPAQPAERLQLARTLRDVQFNPQRHLEECPHPSPVLLELVNQKLAWLTRPTTDPHDLRARHRAMKHLNQDMAPFFHDSQTQLHQQLAQVQKQLHANTILQRRDFAFCLFPEALLRSFCTRFL
jgi:hypothetical protein